MLTPDVRGPDREDRYVVDLAPNRRGDGAVRPVVSAETYANPGPGVAEIGTALQAAG